MDSNFLYKTLYNKAVQLLAQRNHSSAELAQKLTLFYLKKIATNMSFERSIVNSQIDAVIKYCVSNHWLNDQNYIEQYIAMRSRKGYGPTRILLELKQRGLPSVLIKEQLNDPNFNWIEIGLTLINKKYRSLDKNSIQQKIKIFQFLGYRGFQQDEISQIYSLLWS